MTTSAQTSAHGLVRTVPTAAPRARSRPDLPSWFRGATTSLYAACGGLACVLAALAFLTLITPVPVALLSVGAEFLSLFELATILCIGAWCHTIAHSRRIDPTTPALEPVWFLVAWFIPIVHIFVPHRMFGDLWAR